MSETGGPRPGDEWQPREEPTITEVVDEVKALVSEADKGLTFPAPPRPDEAPHGPVEALDAIEKGREQGLTE